MPTPTVASVTADLVAEQETLDTVVAHLADADWDLPTPSPGWTVRDQIGHLAYFDIDELVVSESDILDGLVASLRD